MPSLTSSSAAPCDEPIEEDPIIDIDRSMPTKWTSARHVAHAASDEELEFNSKTVQPQPFKYHANLSCFTTSVGLEMAQKPCDLAPASTAAADHIVGQSFVMHPELAAFRSKQENAPQNYTPKASDAVKQQSDKDGLAKLRPLQH